MCYGFNGSRTHNSLLLVSQSLGKLMGIVGHCKSSNSLCRLQVCGRPVLTLVGHAGERFGGKGARYLGSYGNITLAGTVNAHTHTHASCLAHMAQQIRGTVSSAGVCFSAPTCLYGPGTEGRLGPLERSAVSARDIISVKR